MKNLAIILNYPLQNQIDVGHYDVLETQFASSLQSFDHVYVISPRDSRKYPSKEGITIISNGWSHPFLYFFALAKDIWTLTRLVRKNDVKVIRAMAPTSGFAAIIAAKLTGAKTVVSVHTNEDLTKNDEGRSFLRNLFVDLTVPFVMKNADVIPVISGHIRDYALKKGAKQDHLVFHPNFVDTEKFKPGTKKPNQLLFVGRLSKVKGCEEAIRAMAIITKAQPNAILKIAGCGEEENNLKKLATDMNLEKNVEFLGCVNHETTLPKLMAESAIMLAPRMAGFTLIEALSCGLPIVAGDVEWSRETIRNEENGMLVKEADFQAVAFAALKLMEDENLVREVSIRARKTAEENFSLEAWKQREKKFYTELLGK